MLEWNVMIFNFVFVCTVVIAHIMDIRIMHSINKSCTLRNQL